MVAPLAENVVIFELIARLSVTSLEDIPSPNERGCALVGCTEIETLTDVFHEFGEPIMKKKKRHDIFENSKFQIITLAKETKKKKSSQINLFEK